MFLRVGRDRIDLCRRAGIHTLLLHEGQQMRDGLFHHARAFHHLGQKHFASPEQIANHVHAAHQRAFNYIQ